MNVSFYTHFDRCSLVTFHLRLIDIITNKIVSSIGARTALLATDDNECPDCNEKGSSPGSLIPNRFLRNSVNLFKNKTGYNKPRPKKGASPEPKLEFNSPNINSQCARTLTPSNVCSLLMKIVVVVEEVTQPEEESNEATTPDQATNTAATEADTDRAGEDAPTAVAEATQPNTDEKPNECGTPQTDPHDESDYEDNITVTVPKPQSQSQALSGSSYYRDRSHMNGRYSRPISKPEMGDSVPPTHQQPHPINMNPRYGAPPQQSSQQHG